MRWVWHEARVGELRNSYRILVVKTKGKRLLERPTGRWEYSVTVDLKEIGW
jgi:hypothetical protein